jgi:hypothetical protein
MEPAPAALSDGRQAVAGVSLADQTTPWSSMVSATFTKPAMFAPFT